MDQNQTKTRKQQIAELVKHLHSVKDTDPVAQAFLNLLEILYENSRDDLMRATPMTFERIQGAALAAKNIIKMITTKPLPLPEQQSFEGLDV